MLAVRERKCREHYGEDTWATADPKTKACFDFLCGNHTRNLPVVRFNKSYEKYIQSELGESIRVAKLATGGMARLEGSGVAFLRSLCRLTHVGHAQYYKGDGHAFHDYLEKHYTGTFSSLSTSLRS